MRPTLLDTKPGTCHGHSVLRQLGEESLVSWLVTIPGLKPYSRFSFVNAAIEESSRCPQGETLSGMQDSIWTTR